MKLVKILVSDDGEKQKYAKWHLVEHYGDSPRTICTGEVFGCGEGTAEYKEKISKKGGVTCQKCLSIIKWYKDLKL